MNCIKSAFLKLDWRDIRRGLGLAVATASTYICSAMVSGTIPDVAMWKATGSVFIGAAGTYLVKNLLTNSNDEFLKKEPQ